MKKIIILLILSSILIGCVDIAQQKKFIEEPKIVEQTEKAELPLIVKQKCNDDCVDLEGAVSYLVGYNHSTKLFDCFCLNTAEERIADYSYDYEPGKEAEFTGDNFYDVEKLHWTKMPITYFIINEEECGTYEVNKIKKGFDAIEEATDGVVRFEKINQFADIDIHCSFIENCYEYKVDIREEENIVYRYERICEHAKGIARIAEAKGNRILKAEIELIGLAGFEETTGKGASGFYIGSCGHPTTEIHEILHTFGYGHDNDPNSIMYYKEDSVGVTIQEEGECIGSEKYVDEDIANDLMGIYS